MKTTYVKNDGIERFVVSMHELDVLAISVEETLQELENSVKEGCAKPELIQYVECLRYDDCNMYDVCTYILQPHCKKHKKPYATQKPVDTSFIFVTHGWAGNFPQFVKHVKSSVKMLQKEDNQQLHIWVCSLALLQCCDASSMSMKLDDPINAPFFQALRMATYYLIVWNQESDIFQRIWCCWELYSAFAAPSL